MKNTKLFIFLSIICCLVNYGSDSSANDPVSVDTVKITKVGNTEPQVSMSHETHSFAGVKCIDCHHKVENDDRIKKCAVCHEDEELLHDYCISCHRETIAKPTTCNNCHNTKQIVKISGTSK